MKDGNLAQKNFDDFMTIVQSIQFKRSPDKLLQYLTQSDFFYAPAARSHHDAQQGGLYNHSKKVYNAMRILNKVSKNKTDDQSLFYMGFGHDICKINIYKEKQQWFKDQHNKWQSKPGWQIVDPFPVGHGQKSIIIMLKYVQLTNEQMLAIRWHMGGFDNYVRDQIGKHTYAQAQDATPLTRMLHIADLMAVAIL